MRTDTSHCPRPPRPQNNGERLPLPGDAAGRWMGGGGEDALPPALARAAKNQRASEGARRGGGGARGELRGGSASPTLASALPPGPRRRSRSPEGSAAKDVQRRQLGAAEALGARPRPRGGNPGSPRGSRIPASPRPSLVRRGSGEWSARGTARGSVSSPRAWSPLAEMRL